jgi:hypothetical protein
MSSKGRVIDVVAYANKAAWSDGNQGRFREQMGQTGVVDRSEADS